jgi:signal transduction histidine kinase
MTSRPWDLAEGLRQAVGNPGDRAVRTLLAPVLAAGERGAVFVAAEGPSMGLRLVAAVPGDTAFEDPPARELARRAMRGDAPVTAGPGVAWPVGPGCGALVLVADDPAGPSAETRRRAERLVPALAVVAELEVTRRRAADAAAHVAHFRQMLRLTKPGRDFQEVASEVLDLAVRLVHGHAGGLWLREHRGGSFTLRAARHVVADRGPQPAVARSAVEGLLGAAPIRCPPAPLDEACLVFRDRTLSAALLIPLHRDDELVGLLAVARLDDGRAFDEADADRLLELADLAAVPIVNVCLRDDLRDRARQGRVSRRIGRAISASLSLEEIFRLATQELRRITRFDASAIVVVDETGQDGQVVMGEAGRVTRTLPWSAELAETVTGSAMKLQRPVLVADAGESGERILPFLREPPAARAVISLPLMIGRETVGALVLASRTRGRFRRRDLRLLRPVAEQLAIAVRHARLLRATTESLEDRLRLELRLGRAERDATLGRLAAALAHEIRNPLTVIGTTVQYLRDRFEPDDDRRALLDAADRKVRQMDESLDGLLSFSRPLELRANPGRLAPALQAVAEFVHARAAQQGVEVRVETEPRVPRVVLDQRLMEQAILNLALNALDAMRDGGCLTFALRAAPRHAVVTVADTGGGLTDAKLAALFEPYYTTPRGGTGLGLAITRRIVEEHGGAIEASSEPGRGTTFTVLLPALAAAPEPTHGPDPHPAR